VGIGVKRKDSTTTAAGTEVCPINIWVVRSLPHTMHAQKRIPSGWTLLQQNTKASKCAEKVEHDIIINSC
jgi:hypothetical protein